MKPRARCYFKGVATRMKVYFISIQVWEKKWQKTAFFLLLKSTSGWCVSPFIETNHYELIGPCLNSLKDKHIFSNANVDFYYDMRALFIWVNHALIKLPDKKREREEIMCNSLLESLVTFCPINRHTCRISIIFH